MRLRVTQNIYRYYDFFILIFNKDNFYFNKVTKKPGILKKLGIREINKIINLNKNK